jgi:hypothetical protein
MERSGFRIAAPSGQEIAEPGIRPHIQGYHLPNFFKRLWTCQEAMQIIDGKNFSKIILALQELTLICSSLPYCKNQCRPNHSIKTIPPSPGGETGQPA